MNGTVEGNRNGCFTYISTTGNSVIDYFLISCDFLPYCTYMFVRESISTPHLCVEMSVKGFVSKRTDPEKHVVIKRVWDERLSETYVEQLKENFEELENGTNGNRVDTGSEIDTLCDGITWCFVDAANCMRRRVSYGTRKYGQAWFDTECRVAKSKLQALLRLYRKTLLSSIKLEYNRERNMYKRLLCSKKAQHREAVKSNLLENVHDPAKFWKQVRQLSKGKFRDSRIPIDTWYDHFRSFSN